MTILEIIPSFFPVGGAETFVSDLSLALNKIEGNRVICVCLYNKNKNDFRLVWYRSGQRRIKLNNQT